VVRASSGFVTYSSASDGRGKTQDLLSVDFVRLSSFPAKILGKPSARRLPARERSPF
jgi:hypothetical protein